MREREVIMAKWSNAALTHAGIELLNSTISGATIEITSVKAGSGSVPIVDLRDQTALQNVKQTLQISKFQTMDGVTTISALLSSIGLTESYELQQIGIYANNTNDEEILYAIAQADEATEIPTQEEIPLYSIYFNFHLAMANDVSLSCNVDPAGLVTLAELNEALATVGFDTENVAFTGAFSVNRATDTTEGMYSVAMGMMPVAIGVATISLGIASTASGDFSQAFGYYTSATGRFAQANGQQATASGEGAYSNGYYTNALDYQYVIGHYNNGNTALKTASEGTDGTIFVVGNGTKTARSNAFRVNADGTLRSNGSFGNSGADYAEYKEWLDGNSQQNDRRGLFVTLEGDMIKIAKPGDFILGVISGSPCLIGNADEDWQGKYLKDEYGSKILIDYEYTDADGKKVKTKTFAVNPEYDPSLPYIERAKRPEWDAVGMLGFLVVRDDGSCQVNGYCNVGDGGIATLSESGYRVVQRVSDKLVKILFR